MTVLDMPPSGTAASETLAMLAELEKKVLWLSSWTIHNANHLRDTGDGVKVGGHQASSASLATIMTALYFSVLRPEDRVAVKPHASPVFHAIQYLLGNQTRDKLERFRAYGGAQSYPSRTKDGDDVDFSTGSVGLGAAMTVFASLMQDYLCAHDLLKQPQGRMVALVGDAELDEGNIFECLLEGWKQGLRNCWWIIDYNRQSLDAVVREGLYQRITALFEAMGWEVVVLKYGSLLEAAFREPGGDRLRDWIDRCPNQLYAALTFQGGAAWRKRLIDEIGDQGDVTVLIERRSDEELGRLMTNLGGHDLPTLLAAFEAARDDHPICFLAYTIKGFGLPFQGHKDNHSGLMTAAQMELVREAMQVRPDHEWDRFEGLSDPAATERFLAQVPFSARGRRRYTAESVLVPEIAPPAAATVTSVSTQAAFGNLLNELARSGGPLADRIVTTSPDVTVSTNLGPWVNRRGLFARESLADTFRQERIISPQRWEFSPHGQHVELGIAEMNLFLNLAALGLSHSLFGERLIPIGTLYDPFIARGLDALNYACYQDARFILAATPSGITLAPEGGAHQSIGTPLIGMAQDGLAAFEPAFADELALILAWAFEYLQRDGDGAHSEHTWLRDETGGSVYLRLSTRPIDQPKREITPELATDIVNGGYWMRRPGPNAQVVIAYAGTIAPEAIEAAGLIAEDRRDVGLLAVTSADRLNAGWTAASRARERGAPHARAHVERLLEAVPPHCGIVTVLDGHPATLAWLGSVHGHRVRPLGVEHFGQTGSVEELYTSYGLNSAAIAAAAEALAPGRPIRHVNFA